MLELHRTIISVFKLWKGKKMHPRLSTGAAYHFMPAYTYDGELKCPTVLIVHGWQSNVLRSGGSYDKLAGLLNMLGYHTLQLSLRGHNGSAGDIALVTREDHAEDIRSAVTWLRQNIHTDAARLCAVGTSYGAYMLAALADELDLKRLEFRAPALYPDEGWNEPALSMIDHPDLARWRMGVHSPKENKALRSLSKFRGDLLLVRSQHDEQMPPEVERSYYLAATNAEFVLRFQLEGATHALADPQHQAAFFEVTRKWFKEHYPAPHVARD